MADRFTEEKEFFAALGYVAYESQIMFMALEMLIAGMMSKSEGVDVLTTDLSYAQISHLANALADRIIKGKRELATITAILKEGSRLYAERNKMIHGSWAGYNGEYLCIRWRARGRYTQLEDPIDTADILAVARGFVACRQKLYKFTRRKRFLDHSMFDQTVGYLRQAQRERSRERELVRILDQRQKARQKQQPQRRPASSK